MANFIVDNISDASVMLVNDGEESSVKELKNRAIYNFKACLKDPSVGRPIQDQQFSVVISGEKQSLKTDYSGCLNIITAIRLDSSMCEKIYDYNLEIEGLDLYFGKKIIELSLNPYAQSTKSLIDKRYSNIAVDSSSCEDVGIEIVDTIVENIQTTKGLKFRLAHSPVYRQSLLDGTTKFIPIKSDAVFNTKYHLLAFVNGEAVLVDTVSSDVLLKSGKLEDVVSFKMLPKSISDIDHFEIQYTVKSKDEKFEDQFYSISSRDITFKSREPLVKIDELSEYISIPTEGVDLTKNVDVRELSVKSVVDENATVLSDQRAKKVEMSSCFYDRNSGSDYYNYVNKEFKISADKKDLRIVVGSPSTDEKGCFTFSVVRNYEMFKGSKWIDYNLNFTVNNETVSIPMSINPWLSNSVVRDLRRNQVTDTTEISGTNSLVIDEIKYGQLSNDENEFYVNRFAQLFFEKRYYIKFNPRVLLENGQGHIASPKALNFGKLKINLQLLVGKEASTKDSKEIDLSGFKVITATTLENTIEESGTFFTKFNLPIEVSDALYLAVKSYLKVEVIPTENLNGLEKQTFLIDFFGTSSNESSKTYSNFINFDEAENILGESYITEKNIFSRGLQARTSKSSLELFKEHLANSKINIGSFQTIEDFLSSPRNKKAGINYSNLRILMQVEEQKVPRANRITEKLCLYALPDISDYFKRGECEKNLSRFVTISSAEHIEDIVKVGEYSDLGLTKAEFDSKAEENNGTITRGHAFMAAKGFRAAHSRGEHSGLSESLSASMFYDGPPSVFFFSAGLSKSHEVYTNEDNAKIQMMLNRHATSLNRVNLTYNSIGAKFPAYVKRCVLINVVHNQELSTLVCEKESRRRFVDEKWYFIGEVDANKHGVLTDGIQVGEHAYLKVIRGEKNFSKLWEKFEGQDAKTVIAQMEGFELGEKLLEYKQADEVKLEFEMNKDSSFPGLIRD